MLPIIATGSIPLLNQAIGQQRDDFIVETTIDIAAQSAAAESIEMMLDEQGESRRVGQAAALVMDDQGGIRAMVGGRDYDQSQFNRATQARRQPGLVPITSSISRRWKTA